MSDIPYSVRDKIANVTNIRGLNFADISDNELFKKTNDTNIGGANIFVTDAGAISLGVNNYGAVGEVITSGGPSATANWSPGIVASSFLMKTTLGSDFTTFGQVPQGYVTVPNMVEEFNGINVFYGTWDAGNNKWICPVNGTGFYNVNCLVDIRGQRTDVLREARARISVTATDGTKRTIGDTGSDNGGQNGSEQDRRWVNAFGLDRILAGESIDIIVNWTVQPNASLPEGIIIGAGTNLTISRAYYPF